MIIFIIILVSAFYSINVDNSYYNKLTNAGTEVFHEAPTAEHVADIYARISGHPPLLREDKVNLPSVSPLETIRKPAIVEVHGGRLPENVKPVIKANAFTSTSHGPSLENIVSVLKENGIEVDNTIIKKSDEVSEWLKNYDGPVVFLHHETPSSQHYIHRELSMSSISPLTEFQISQYQICLWAGIIFVSVAAAAVCSIIQMEVVPDSLLFAKFISARTHKND
jgi:hypothetical protein